LWRLKYHLTVFLTPLLTLVPTGELSSRMMTVTVDTTETRASEVVISD
jgi:hypothetical protein